MTSWFKDIFGVPESSYEATRRCFEVEDGGRVLVSLANKQRFYVGDFECPSVVELRDRFNKLSVKAEEEDKKRKEAQRQASEQQDDSQEQEQGPAEEKKNGGQDEERKSDAMRSGITFENIVGNVTTLIQDRANRDSVFQAASQFNCLEMVGPSRRPEDGITGYVYDKTQGPACALACPAGTLFRNYFVNDSGQGGSSQIDTLADAGEILKEKTPDGKTPHRYWKMKNGYALPATRDSMQSLSERLKADSKLKERVLGALRIGVHWSTEVHHKKKTAKTEEEQHRVCQLYCSALPVAYAKHVPSTEWTEFATTILEGAYESSILAAGILAMQRKKRVCLFLTQLGGGVFGNRQTWIRNAMKKACRKHRNLPVDIKLVHYSSIPSFMKAFSKELKK